MKFLHGYAYDLWYSEGKGTSKYRVLVAASKRECIAYANKHNTFHAVFTVTPSSIGGVEPKEEMRLFPRSKAGCENQMHIDAIESAMWLVIEAGEKVLAETFSETPELRKLRSVNKYLASQILKLKGCR